MDLLADINASGLAANYLERLDEAANEYKARVFRNYADLLYDTILNAMHPRRADLMTELENNLRNGIKSGVTLWSYTTTHHQGLSSDKMNELSAIGLHTVVFDDEVPMSVDRIVQNSDLVWRLAYTFGTRFRVRRVRCALRSISEDYSAYEYELRMEFVPEGLSEWEVAKLTDTYKACLNRPFHVGRNVHLSPRY